MKNHSIEKVLNLFRENTRKTLTAEIPFFPISEYIKPRISSLKNPHICKIKQTYKGIECSRSRSNLITVNKIDIFHYAWPNSCETLEEAFRFEGSGIFANGILFFYKLDCQHRFRLRNVAQYSTCERLGGFYWKNWKISEKDWKICIRE